MTKRRDKRNRVLRSGESQSADGRYRFTYYENGKQRCIYSWKLETTDRLPAGKRECLALREMERDLGLMQDMGQQISASHTTVSELVKKYTDLRRDVRTTTRIGYKTVMNFLAKDPLGSWMIDNVRTSDAKRWFISLQESGKSYSTIHTIRGVLRPAFQLAVEDDLIVKNPFDFELSQVIVNDSVRREALSRKDERRFLDFIKHDKHFSRYYDGVYILFKTGLRISEFCGLTMQDIDFDEKTIRIDHQLQRTSDMRYSIVPTKTNAGTRVIPMTPDVEKCFRHIVGKRMNKPRRECAIDGKKGFLFFDKNGRPMVAMHWEKYFQHMVEKYNKIYRDQLPEITPHVCRHTYCSDMAKAGISPKTLQYLMGHSEIGVTMNTYTHFGLEEAQREIEAIG